MPGRKAGYLVQLFTVKTGSEIKIRKSDTVQWSVHCDNEKRTDILKMPGGKKICAAIKHSMISGENTKNEENERENGALAH